MRRRRLKLQAVADLADPVNEHATVLDKWVLGES